MEIGVKEPINLFYEEPEPDRWVRFDRYPRRIVRRIVRGAPQLGGMQRFFLNLCSGLDRLKVRYNKNDYASARDCVNSPVGIVGKPQVLKRRWLNPIVFGPAVFSHPSDDPNLLSRLDIRKILVSCEWMKQMFDEVYEAGLVEVWAAGIDTDLWTPSHAVVKDIDLLIYDKIRWKRGLYEKTLFEPIIESIRKRGLQFATVRYGSYQEAEFHMLLGRSRGMVFLCEHETQGFAYLQALSCDVPIIAWDRGGYWQDPAFFPNRVKFGPVTSVPYWNAMCGTKFGDFSEFDTALSRFLDQLDRDQLRPRHYVVENLTLEQRAAAYVDIIKRTTAEK